MVGGNEVEPPRSDERVIPRMLGPQPNLANPAVLTHRQVKVCLDNAFTLIDGHPSHWPCHPPALSQNARKDRPPKSLNLLPSAFLLAAAEPSHKSNCDCPEAN